MSQRLNRHNAENAGKNRLLRWFIHVAEKRHSWRIEALQTAVRVGDWNFASFEAVTGQTADPNIPDENINDCFTGHDVSASPTRDFIFTRRLVDACLSAGTVQYFYCPLPGRIPCRP